jgi:lysozyme
MTDLQESVIVHEAIMESPYKDSLGLWTVGVGRCLERSPLTGDQWKRLLDAGAISVKLTNSGSLMLLDDDLKDCMAACAKAFTFWGTLDEGRRDVLVEMAFQIGIDGLRKFAKMLAAIASHDFKAAAAAGIDSLWAKQTPARAHELMHRMEYGT